VDVSGPAASPGRPAADPLLDGALRLRGRRVLVWGFGRHGGGLAAGRYAEAAGAVVAVLDAKPAKDLGTAADEARARGWAWHVGDGSHPALQRADLIIASPAIPPRAWPATHPPVASPEAFFFASHRGPRVAVTGTKGKSTTSTILGRLLGWPVAGNSHEPLLDALARLGPETPLVCELSSFQLWYLREVRPVSACAVIPSLAVDHLDWHPDVAHYHAAKMALVSWCGVAAVADAVAPAVPPGVRLLPRCTWDGAVFRDPAGVVVAARSDLSLLGDHNAGNACVALAAARFLGAPDPELGARLRQVRALPHRLQEVHAAGGWRFVNDSIATTPEAAMAALAALPGPLAVILGGSDKGADFAALGRAVAVRGATPFLIGQTADRLASALSAAGVAAPRLATLEAAVAAAVEALTGGGTVLLAPACASLDMFRGFEDRGERFTAAARRLRLGA
jgi:UDP-N-acetylmuramoylalanine--D-glutamate ligase